ncbi:MAG: FtsW/RodA/SpoVE family cell cycle protein [Solirubrobacterales bacterium]|nr:FtsW/RodA/SpoVE family cell cycle protein [Solirubrobacterales bacterium]
MSSPRARELFGLLPVSLLVTAGFTAVLLTRTEQVSNVTLVYGGFFLVCCLFAHLFIRARLAEADPYLFPLVALLAAFGLVMIYRIDADLAREQAQWFVIGLVIFCATVLFLRDIRTLERYRYTIVVAGLVLLVMPRVPGIGEPVNGAYLGVRVGPVSFQPAEFAKLAVIVFLASYLNETRDVLVRGRFGRLSLKHLGPLLLIWGLAMFMLVFIRDLGSSLMFFGGFLALLYVATGRLAFVVIGTALFFGGAAFFASTVGHVQDRIAIWQDPFARGVVDDEGYQIAQGLFAQADGGLFGQGLGQALLELPGGSTILPLAQSDLIYALIVNELGLFGATAVLLIYLLIVARGLKTALIASDGFSKLLATGLTAVLALQVFVIVGGVTKLIPLTGVTLPFISYGGSSIVANFMLLALLLIVSDRARREPGRGGLVA